MKWTYIIIIILLAGVVWGYSPPSNITLEDGLEWFKIKWDTPSMGNFTIWDYFFDSNVNIQGNLTITGNLTIPETLIINKNTSSDGENVTLVLANL